MLRIVLDRVEGHEVQPQSLKDCRRALPGVVMDERTVRLDVDTIPLGDVEGFIPPPPV